MHMAMNPVVHFEMPMEDQARAKKFYESVFGWQMTQLGPEMGDYLLAGTTETDETTRRPKNPGAINGGFYPKGQFGTSSHVVISVDDVKKHIEIVKAEGGTVEGEPIDIPGIGTYVMFHDTEGNRVGMLQPTKM